MTSLARKKSVHIKVIKNIGKILKNSASPLVIECETNFGSKNLEYSCHSFRLLTVRMSLFEDQNPADR